MSELSHQDAYRLIHKGQLTIAEREALRRHLRQCPACRSHAAAAGAMISHLVLEQSPTRPSPQFTAVYRERAARRARRSQIMKPIYAVGGAVALALFVLAGWFIVRANPQAASIDPAPVETVQIVPAAEKATETAVPPTEPPAPAPSETPEAAPAAETAAAYQTYTVGEDLWGAEFADLNGDEYPDAVLGDIGINSLILLLNRGDGTFEEFARLATGENPYGVAAADLDGDGDNDLVIGNDPEEGGDAMSVLLNNGDGSFQPQVDYPTAEEAAWWPTPIDLDGDGDLDLVVDLITGQSPLSEAGVGLWYNNGDGTFTEGERTFFDLSMIGNIVPEDLDGDGRIDLVVRSFPDPQVSVLLGTGDGTFGQRLDYETEDRTYDMVVADLNGDEFPDIATGNAYGIVSVMYNDGTGAFPDRDNYDVGGEIWNVLLLDRGSGALPDLLVGPTSSGMASLLSNEDGVFEQTRDYYYPGAWSSFLNLADVDMDGRPELIGYGDDSLHIYPLDLPE